MIFLTATENTPWFAFPPKSTSERPYASPLDDFTLDICLDHVLGILLLCNLVGGFAHQCMRSAKNCDSEGYESEQTFSPNIRKFLMDEFSFFFLFLITCLFISYQTIDGNFQNYVSCGNSTGSKDCFLVGLSSICEPCTSATKTLQICHIQLYLPEYLESFWFRIQCTNTPRHWLPTFRLYWPVNSALCPRLAFDLTSTNRMACWLGFSPFFST